MSGDALHTPTNAGPDPTDTVAPSAGTWQQPAGTAVPAPDVPPSSSGPADRPEALVGAAFAGGLVAALILKRLGR